LPAGSLQIIRIEQIYGFIALGLIYFALLASPLTAVFPGFRYREQYIFARRGIGVAGFYFAVLHTALAFFGQLGGFTGVKYYTTTYSVSISLGTLALVVLLIMALTSFDGIIRAMSYRRWKLMHRSVYIAGLAIIVHFALIGSQYMNGVDAFFIITYLLIALLLVLEVLRFRIYLKKRREKKKGNNV